MFSHKLEALARHYNVAKTTEHRALSDSIVLKSVFLNVLNEKPPITDLEDLFKYVRPMKIEAVETESLLIPKEWQQLNVFIEKKQSISIYYEGGNGIGSKRQITPLKFIQNRGTTYINAICHIDNREKHFRLDRIIEIWWD